MEKKVIKFYLDYESFEEYEALLASGDGDELTLPGALMWYMNEWMDNDFLLEAWLFNAIDEHSCPYLKVKVVTPSKVIPGSFLTDKHVGIFHNFAPIEFTHRGVDYKVVFCIDE